MLDLRQITRIYQVVEEQERAEQAIAEFTGIVVCMVPGRCRTPEVKGSEAILEKGGAAVQKISIGGKQADEKFYWQRGADFCHIPNPDKPRKRDQAGTKYATKTRRREGNHKNDLKFGSSLTRQFFVSSSSLRAFLRPASNGNW